MGRMCTWVVASFSAASCCRCALANQAGSLIFDCRVKVVFSLEEPLLGCRAACRGLENRLSRENWRCHAEQHRGGAGNHT